MLRWLITSLICFYSHISFANEGHRVRQCGLSQVQEQGEIKFSGDEQYQSATLKANIDSDYHRFRLTLMDVSIDEPASTNTQDVIYVTVKTPSQYEGGVDYWRRGVEFDVSELDSSHDIEFYLEVKRPKSTMRAGHYRVNMVWDIDCE